MVRHAKDPRGSSRDDLELPDVGGLVDRPEPTRAPRASKRDDIGIRRQSEPEIKKQISIFVSLDDWKALRSAAAAQNVAMTEICRQALAPVLAKLRAAG